ncbi:DUF61 family protein [Caldisphaera lagunensis]|uniref:DUF61 family protein n=1 Tax=Caldisphaera lagunensis TaxID=200415 RepID=UPI000662276E|nr:DUF61 family protein [Caldisphaera lagunensis]
MESNDKSIKSLQKKILDKINETQKLWPKETLNLIEVYNGKTSVLLESNEYHEFDKEEIKTVLEIVPQYFWKFIKLPILLRYNKDSEGRSWYNVLGDTWQKRFVEILITGQYSFDGIEELDVEMFLKILKKFKSLIFVSVF